MADLSAFDSVIDRRGTDAYKWDRRTRTRDGRDVLPMWVADMDFAVAPAIARALAARAAHPVYGYTFAPASLDEAFRAWQLRRNGWHLEPEWLTPVPAVMPALRAAILELTQPGDEVVVQPPVYFPFFDAVRENGRHVAENPLRLEGDRYVMDLDGLRRMIGPRTRMLLLCSPHNPVGRVWTRDELAALAGICAEHRLVVVADEIHSDIVRPGHRFVPFASVSPEAAGLTVACHSPSKTFNIAGLASASAVIPDRALRIRFAAAVRRFGLSLPNTLSFAAARAAYEEGEPWLDALLEYLDRQYTWLEAEVERRFAPDVRLTPIEGTYLAWLDCRRLLERAGADDAALRDALFEGAGLWLSDGPQFGAGGGGYQRMNLACPHPLLAEGLSRFERAAAILLGRRGGGR